MPVLSKHNFYVAMLFASVLTQVACDTSVDAGVQQGVDSTDSEALSSSALPITLDRSDTKCLDILGSNHAIGTAVTLNDCNTGSNQRFAYANGQIQVYVHRCLEVAGGQDALGAKVVINDCDPNSSNQMWSRTGRTWVWNKSDKCLDLPGNNVVNGAPLQIWACNGSAAQNWSDPTPGSQAAPQPATPPVAALPTPSTTNLPIVHGTCPILSSGMANFLGQPVQLWAADASHRDGSLVLFWHSTGSNSQQASNIFGDAQIADVVAKGGMVASFTNTTQGGANITGNSIWFTSDFVTADEVVACAIRDLHIDPRRIYVTGASAGGLMSTWMAYARSGYIAAAAPISGGMLGQNGRWATPSTTPQDASNVPFALVVHGAKGVDVYAPTNFDFANSSAEYESDINSKGGVSIDCNTGGAHMFIPSVTGPTIWQFFQDHPFKTSPEPYQGKLPETFPSWCKAGPVPF